MTSKALMAVAVAVVIGGSQLVTAQRGRSMRFKGLDRNNDGRISRAEWNGNDRSFQVHDWNGDGILSGDEVKPGGRGADQDAQWDATGREIFSDWTARGFNSVDRNRDNRITADEWRYSRDDFRRADHNRDGIVTRSEFLNDDADPDEGRTARFVAMDANGDNRISRDEWRGSRENFDLLDDNGDGRLTRAEAFGMSAAGAARSAAYEAGRARGLIEGRAAGREDRERNQGWDLEGQQELEQADSGYLVAHGSRTDYQAGYRAAFRAAYREGYGPR